VTGTGIRPNMTSIIDLYLYQPVADDILHTQTTTIGSKAEQMFRSLPYLQHMLFHHSWKCSHEAYPSFLCALLSDNPPQKWAQRVSKLRSFDFSPNNMFLSTKHFIATHSCHKLLPHMEKVYPPSPCLQYSCFACHNGHLQLSIRCWSPYINSEDPLFQQNMMPRIKQDHQLY